MTLVADAAATAAAPAKRYRFVAVDECNMCGASGDSQVLLGRRLDGRQGLWPKWKRGVTTSIVRCRVCHLIYPNPMPIPELVGEHYDVPPGHYWTESGYFEDPLDYFTATIETFSRLSGREPRDCSALDVGAGLGKAMVALDRAGFDVVGIEVSASFRRAAIDRTRIAEKRLLLTSVEDADFSPNAFDFVNLSAVLEHLPDPAAVLKRSVDWLKPGGLIYVEVPSSHWLLSRLMRTFYRLTGSNYVINTCPMHSPYHLYEFGLESFVRNGRPGGYRTVFHRYHPCATYLPGWIAAPMSGLMRHTDTGMQLEVWLRKQGQAD